MVRLGAEVRAETDDRRRQLRSRMLLHSRGRTAADDALLDRRTMAGELLDPGDEIDFLDVDPVGPPPPVRAGRWRAPRPRPEPPVARVQRTYQRPRRPWDR